MVGGRLTSVAALASPITFYIAVAHYFLEEQFNEEAGKQSMPSMSG